MPIISVLERKRKCMELPAPSGTPYVGQSALCWITDVCVNCAACVDSCPPGAIWENGDHHEVDNTCIGCRACVDTCPVDAIGLSV